MITVGIIDNDSSQSLLPTYRLKIMYSIVKISNRQPGTRFWLIKEGWHILNVPSIAMYRT